MDKTQSEEQVASSPRPSETRLIHLLLDRSTVVIALVFIAILAILVWHRTQLENRLVEATAQEVARRYAEALSTFRTIYTRDVVARVKAQNIVVTHDYDQDKYEGKAIPLPATLSMLIGNEMAKEKLGGQTALYSGHPFPWREDEWSGRDSFAKDAWVALSENQEESYYRFENRNGHRWFRYATADVMKKSCVECHNQHPQTPKNDWKVGDVRGVLEVSMPLDTAVAQAQSNLHESIISTLAIGGLGFLALIVVIGRLRRTSVELETRVEQRTAEVSQHAAAVRKHEAELQAVVASVLDGIITIDQHGIIHSFNPAAQKIFGYDNLEVIGQNVKMLMPEPYRAEHDGYLRNYLETGEAKIIGIGREVVGKRKDGSTFPMELAVSEVAVGEGRLFTGIVRDISERKKAEEVLRVRTAELAQSEGRIRAIFEAAVDAIVTIDQRGRIRQVNSAAVKLFGYSVEEMQGQNVKMLMPEPYRAEHDGYLRNYLETGEAKIIGIGREVVGKRKDGSTFPMELAVSEVAVGEERLFTGIVRDISERKKAEDDLREAKNEADQANQAKSSFLANMSHELRTPMNAILGYSEMLEEEAEERGQENFIPDLRRIHSSGKHLLKLINDILDLSKVEAGKVELACEIFDVAKLLEEVVSTVQPLIDKNSNTLKVNCPPDIGTVFNDMTRIRQVLFNLLSNAAKFTDRGVITLAVKREAVNEKEIIRFTVHDSGIGMTEDQVNKVFDPFTQADNSTTRKYGGTGLGLTICREFCKIMGGDITAKSVMGEGSTFSAHVLANPGGSVSQEGVKLSVRKGGAEKDLIPVSSGGDTVLVIDDDPAALDLVSRILIRDGYQVRTAVSGEKGMEAARKLHPMVIILDVMMPSMDGWAVLSALKKDPELAAIPVIMHTMVAGQEMGYALGADDYLLKPIDRNSLLKIIKKFRFHAKETSILVVEDDVPTREMLCGILSKAGWTVLQADNGRSAFEVLKNEQPSMILLDLMMPQMDGFEFVEKLRKEERWNKVPVVVMTAKDLSEEDRLRLSGNVLQILQKGALGRQALLAELKRLTRL